MPSLLSPIFAVPTASHFPIGQSPFRIKGRAYLGVEEYVRAHVPLGIAAIDRVSDPEVRTYLQQSFRESDWYDPYPLAILCNAIARTAGITLERLIHHGAVYQGERHMQGAYGALLRVVSTQTVARWAPWMLQLFFEFVRVETSTLAPRMIACHVKRIPADLVQFGVWASIGVCEGALRAQGAKDVRVDLSDPTFDSTEHGVDLYTITATILWGG